METTKCDKRIVICDVGTTQCGDETVKYEKKVREPPNVRKKSKGTTECDKKTITCEDRTVECEKKVREPSNVTKELSHVRLELHNVMMQYLECEKKSKGTIECDKRTVTCDVRTE